MAQATPNNRAYDKTIDLFAGLGGIRLGFEASGFDTVFANDFELQCQHTYDLNFPDPQLFVGDIQAIAIEHLPEFDFLLGGFPCQPFSIAGYRQGFEDKRGRGSLFFTIVDILKAHQPAGFFLENVKNLATHNNGETLKIIKDELEDAGYSFHYAVLNSSEYGGVPQNRERIYPVGFRKDIDLSEPFTFPSPIPLEKAVTDMLEAPDVIADKYYYEDKPVFAQFADYGFEEGVVYQWRRKYIRANKSGLCPTLTANMGTGGHNVPLVKDTRGIRKLTPRECARFQGFPETYQFPDLTDSHLYKQLGNSVTVPVIKRIAEQIRSSMPKN